MTNVLTEPAMPMQFEEPVHRSTTSPYFCSAHKHARNHAHQHMLRHAHNIHAHRRTHARTHTSTRCTRCIRCTQTHKHTSTIHTAHHSTPQHTTAHQLLTRWAERRGSPHGHGHTSMAAADRCRRQCSCRVAGAQTSRRHPCTGSRSLLCCLRTQPRVVSV